MVHLQGSCILCPITLWKGSQYTITHNKFENGHFQIKFLSHKKGTATSWSFLFRLRQTRCISDTRLHFHCNYRNALKIVIHVCFHRDFSCSRQINSGSTALDMAERLHFSNSDVLIAYEWRRRTTQWDTLLGESVWIHVFMSSAFLWHFHRASGRSIHPEVSSSTRITAHRSKNSLWQWRRNQVLRWRRRKIIIPQVHFNIPP